MTEKEVPEISGVQGPPPQSWLRAHGLTGDEYVKSTDFRGDTTYVQHEKKDNDD